jgi:amino acid adenylation domain-containing protein
MLTSYATENQTFFPLSHGEERLWFLYQFQPDRSIYNIVHAYRLLGNLNVVALQKSLHQLVERHQNLRKQFIDINGAVTSRIAPSSLFILKHITHSGSESEKEKSLGEVVMHEKKEPFNLASDLPFRALIISINQEEYGLVLSIHHIVSDAWSHTLLLRDLQKLYLANAYGHDMELPSLLNEYYQYPQMQKKRVAEDAQEHITYWMEHLNGKIDRLKLPYDRQPTDTTTFEGSLEEELLPAPLVQNLREVTQRNGATMFMTFFASFHTLLHKYSNNRFIVTGIPIAGRAHEETRDLIGYFANTLMLATDFSDDPLFVKVLGDVKALVLDSFEHQALPFEMLAAELRRTTRIDANDLIQVMFSFENNPDADLYLEGLKVESIPHKTTTAKFDLSVFISEAHNRYKISFEYKTDLFNRSTIRRMMNSFVELLYSVSRNPDWPVSQLDWVSAHEKTLVTQKWNATDHPIPQLCTHEIFELQAEDTPNEIAINYEGKDATYRELNDRANQLAAYLTQLRIRQEEPVGILMEESDQAIVAELAVLKAGGAYLPLDPAYPKERLAYMLEVSESRKVITTNKYAGYLDTRLFDILNIDENSELISSCSKDSLKLNLRPNSLSNIMFTSGSTGRPKGAALEHRGIIRLVIDVDYLNFGPETRVLKTGAFSFDASTLEVWGTLLNGGRLYISTREKLLDNAYLKKKIISEKISTLWITSSWFNQLADIDPEMFGSLKLLLVGGDKLSTKHINKVIDSCPASLQIFNAYGPTENSVFSTVYKIEGKQSDPIPIGRPIPNSAVYVLDTRLKPVPVGAEGEIYVGGVGVARGYINNSELTAQKFLPDPFRPDGQMYKTGDAGRWLENGVLEFIGRKDNQIKLRGFRIEVGEIEHCLSGHPKIKESIVLVHGTSEGDKRLIAFYIKEEDVTTAEIRNFLRESLPEHMIPAQFISVKSFPLTANGKVDRNELAKNVSLESIEPVKFEKPANAIEEKLLEIWEEVLARKPISVSDSFFLLGGHSLLATRLMSKIKTAFNRDLAVSLLFKAPSVRELGAIISKEIKVSNKMNGSSLVPVQPNGSQPPLFVIPGYLFYFNLSKYLGDDQPLYGFEPIPDLSIEDVSAVYIRGLKRIQPDGPYYIGGYCAGGIVAYEMARQLSARGDRIGLLALYEVYTPEGVVSKASPKYLRDRFNYLTVNFRAANLNGKLKMVSKECKKIFRAFASVFSREPHVKYEIKPYDGPIKLFKAMDGMVGSAEDPYMGWSKYCAIENLEVISVPGNHDTMFKEPHVPTLSRYMETLLVRSRSEMTKERFILSA